MLQYHNMLNWFNVVFVSALSLANVDPVDVAKSIAGLNPETTLGN